MAAILKLQCITSSKIQKSDSLDAYLVEEQPCQISPNPISNDLAFGFFYERTQQEEHDGCVAI